MAASEGNQGSLLYHEMLRQSHAVQRQISTENRQLGNKAAAAPAAGNLLPTTT